MNPQCCGGNANQSKECGFVILTSLLILIGGTTAFLFGYFLPPKIQEEPEEPEGAPANIRRYPTSSLINRAESVEPPTDSSFDEYNWLASVSMYRYKDQPGSLEFFCTGTIMSPDKVMTGDACLKEYFDLKDLKDAIVRSSSAYFYGGGQIHTVERIFDNPKLKRPFRNVFILEVVPNFSDNTIKPVIVAAETVLRPSTREGKFVTLGWGGDQDQTEQVEKKRPFTIREWLPEKFTNCKSTPCHNASKAAAVCCNQASISNRPLLKIGPVSGKVLVNIRSGNPQIAALELVHVYKGEKSTESDLEYFIDVGDEPFLEWLKTILPTTVEKPNEKIDKHHEDSLPIYSTWQTEEYLNDLKFVEMYNPLAKYITDVTEEIHEK